MGDVRKVQNFGQTVAPQSVTKEAPLALPQPMQETAKALNISLLQLPTLSTRTKVEVAAIGLFLTYRATTLAASGNVPAILAIVGIYLAYKAYQIGLKNILTYCGQNATAVAAAAILGPDGSRMDLADEMEAAGEATLENLGAVGMFIIPHPQVEKKEEPKPALPQEDEKFMICDLGVGGLFMIPIPEKSEPQPTPKQPEPEEEVDNWAASMGGIFFGFVQMVGFLFLM